MPRGGKRPGAGRKPGSATRKTRAIAEGLAHSGLTPLDYMLKVMNHPKADNKRRDEMAKSAAGYCYPRLAAIEHKRPPIDLTKLTDEELEQLMELYRRAEARAAENDQDETAPLVGNAGPRDPDTRH